MNQIIVPLNITADEYLKLYQGEARTVFCQSLDGQTIRFPAGILQPFVTHDGVSGTFRIVFDGDNRFQSIARV